MKTKIIEIIEIGNPQSLIQRDGEPASELIKTIELIDELNKYLELTKSYVYAYECDCNFDMPIIKTDGSGYYEYRCENCGKLDDRRY